MNEVLVLVHGAFHGPWCWHPTMTVVRVTATDEYGWQGFDDFTIAVAPGVRFSRRES